MYCHNCGTEIPEGNRFCENCGTETEDYKNNILRKQENKKNNENESRLGRKAVIIIITLMVVAIIVSIIGVKTFKINPKETSISKITAAKKGFTVKWKKQTAKMSTSRITGYQIGYSTKSSMNGAKTATIFGYSKCSKKVTKLKAKKKYYVQIRTYKTVGGVNYYSSWSAKKAVKTK